jgi:ABC-type antimicrobial peptide transport system permease subunit
MVWKVDPSIPVTKVRMMSEVMSVSTGDVMRLVLRQGLTLSLLGIAAGVCVSLAATRVLTGLLYGVAPTDPVTFATVALVLVAVALIACLVPARRAMRVDPIVALRYE